MKKLIAAGIVSLLVVSCQKNTASLTTNKEPTVTPAMKPANFIFGVYDCPHMSNNLPVYTFFFADTSKVFRTVRYFSGVPMASWFLSTAQPMPDTAFTVMTSLINTFPAYLVNNPNITIGATPNVPADYLYIASVTGSDTTTWNVNMDTTKVPVAIRPYMMQMQQAWIKLYGIH